MGNAPLIGDICSRCDQLVGNCQCLVWSPLSQCEFSMHVPDQPLHLCLRRGIETTCASEKRFRLRQVMQPERHCSQKCCCIANPPRCTDFMRKSQRLFKMRMSHRQSEQVKGKHAQC